MPKLTLNDVTSGYASTTAVNANNALIEAAFENTLSRDGTLPNSMLADLDMNGNLILNSGNAVQVSGFTWEGPWITAQSYQVGDIVEFNGAAYMAIVAHTSGAFATDLAAAKWQLFASAALPSQTAHANKFLQTSGSTLSWKVPQASEVSYTPTGTVAATTVQGAVSEVVSDLAASSGSSLVGFTQAGTGAVARTVQAKCREFVSVSDFGTLAQAQTAAGVKSLLNSTTGTEWKLGITAPTFDEAANALGRNLAFDSLGATISIGAGLQYNLIGMRNAGSEINFTLGASSALASGLSFYMSSQLGSDSTSNLYGVIGNLSNYGPGTTKALYGRVTAKSGMTGDLIAGVLRTQLDTGSTHASAYCLQIGPAGDTAKVLTGIIRIDTEAASGKAGYGILSDIAIGYTIAFIRGVAGGGGKAFQWQASGGGADLMNILESGQITLAPATAHTRMLDLQSGARINFTATSATASAGTGGAPPAQVAQYIIVQVGGTDYKIPVYHV